MDLFVDIEKVMLKKQLSFKQASLIFVLVCSLSCVFILGLADENYLLIVSVLICAFLCSTCFKEIKKLQARNQVISFQKDIAINGFDASIFAFFVFSEAGKCVFVNRIAQNLFAGFKVRTIEDFILCFGKYPKAVEAVHKLHNLAKNSKQSHIDVPMKLRADTMSLWRIAVSPLPDQKGFFGWTIIDLTPSENKVESIDTNPYFLLEIINNSNSGYFCVNNDNEIVFCNKVFANWLGIHEDSVANTSIFKYIEKEELASFLGNNKESKLIPDSPIKVKLKADDGSVEDVVVKQLLQQTNDTKCFMVSKESINQTGDLLQALGKTKLYFEHIFEDAPLGILITDGAETISTCNKTFKNIVKSKDFDNTSSFLDFVSDEDRESVRTKVYHLITGVHQTIDPFEIQLNIKPSKSIMIYASKIEEHKRTKDNDGLVIYFVDVTERKELQHQFVQSQKMQAVGQLAGGVAHDFNNLLTAMIGYCDLLLEKYLPSDQPFNDIMQIKQNANRASNLVRQLLAFSRQQTLQPKVLGTTDMINELIVLLKRLLGAKIELKVNHTKESEFIKVDQIQFEQIIINLAVNARDAMKDGGVLSIQTSPYDTKEPKILKGGTMPAGEYVLIEVSDTGTGIDEKYLNRIFDPFFSTKEKGHGTGLGLSTVYGIVNQTGGFISVDTEVGVGTKFSLYFPKASTQDISSAQIREKANEPKIVDLTGAGTILLVEDEDAVRMFSSRALRDKGYNVIEASNGESALEFIKKGTENIELIISDVVMPKMDGPTLMENVKLYKSGIKIIFTSGYTEDNFRESLVNGDDKVHFLSKPFNLKELACKVKEVMG